jgi:hypothetical protein
MTLKLGSDLKRRLLIRQDLSRVSGEKFFLVRAAAGEAVPWILVWRRYPWSVERVKNATGMKHFCLKDFSDFLPISKSRRQPSLDSSQTLSNGQWLHLHTRSDLPLPFA